MTKEEINGLLKKIKDDEYTPLSFSLKKRNTLKGYIVKAGDFKHLNEKNYWHILKQERKSEWLSSRNLDLLFVY